MSAQALTLDLQGEWSCMLDPNGVGEEKNWNEALPIDLAQSVILPGSLDTNEVGQPTLCSKH